MNHPIIIETLVNEKVQIFREEALANQMLNQAGLFRKGMLETIGQLIQKLREKRMSHIPVVNPKAEHLAS